MPKGGRVFTLSMTGKRLAPFPPRLLRHCLWANANTRLAERDVRICSKANSNSHTYNQMPSRPKLFLWTSDKYSWPPWPWIPTVEISLEQPSRLHTVWLDTSNKRWSKAHRRNVHRRNGVAEISHSVGNLCSSAVYDQGQPTLIFDTISCGLQSKADNNRVNTAGT